MLWKDKLNEFRSGKILTYPKCMNRKFFFETSVYENENSEFREQFINSILLEMTLYNKRNFDEYINKSIYSFYNLSGDTKLVIPHPSDLFKYTTIKDFMDNATLKEQQVFWFNAANEIQSFFDLHGKVYVSTHGLCIGYFHLRLCTYPKYYSSNI